MQKKYFITFAGVPGSSKSQIASFLSWNLGLPVFSNDIIRNEIRADLLEFDQTKYQERRDDRLKTLLQSGRSFIYDASVDRQWKELNEWLQRYSYSSFIISIDLSASKIETLYSAKGYSYESTHLPSFFRMHNDFLNEFNSQIGVRITDKTYSRRLEISLAAIESFIANDTRLD